MAGKPYKHDAATIRRWRIRATNLSHNPSLSAAEICRIIGREDGTSPHTVRYHTFHARRDFESYRRWYARNYMRISRHLDSVLPTLYNGNSELSLAELTGRIESNAGIAMRESTLEKLLGKYEGNKPLVKTESGKYHLNQSYYQS